MRDALTPELLDARDEYGMTALHMSVSIKWFEAVELLLAAGADRETRYFRTGATALYTAVQEKHVEIVDALLRAGANPDAANYWGITPRSWAKDSALASLFAEVPPGDSTVPAPRIQNAEHLADHYHPRFRIPSRKERESLEVGTAVDVHVLGPKPPAVKVRIDARSETGAATSYSAHLDPPTQETNLAPDTTRVSFGPEHVATAYLRKK